MTEHDLIVVGMGPAGEEVAGQAAAAGLDVLGVERKLVGGECPYWGCIPSKAMVRAGNSLAEAARVTGLAGKTAIEADWAPVAARVRDMTAGWSDEIAVERHEKKGGRFVRGAAHVVGPRAVEVNGVSHSARRGIVLATGTEPLIPPIEGLDDVEIWTNREAIEAQTLPDSLLILGGGPVGLELGQTFARFGTKVTIVEGAAHVLPLEEPENGAALGDALRAEGIEILNGARGERVARARDGIAVELTDGSRIEGERLLVATGRRPSIAGIGLETIGVDPDARSIEVDEHMRAGEGLWAVGDITGKGMFTHVAMYQARIASADILGREHQPADYSAVPRVTFTDPEVASVGMSERVAREAGITLRTGVATTSSSARGWIHGPGAEHGVAKVVIDADRDILVGASVMGPAAGEVLGLLVLAIKAKIGISTLRAMIYPYPTFVRGLEDALREAAG